MTKPFILPGPDRDQRSDTISLMSTTSYDPAAPRPTTPLLIGKYVVYRKPLAGTPLTVYMIMFGNVVAGTQVSLPTKADCDTATKRHRAALEARAAEQAARDAQIAERDAKRKEAMDKRKAANAARAKVAA
ncbi:hypothetical protein PPN31114_03532 [Pandoraea pneumonica]|uniref:Beta-hexosaminidase n=1 Tax=Pandoraea pneumonica TaxID=2508299 RepID=A0A5E4WY26_9BURK|nr:beta-hexosaminidase [Pandoraea pneumonica]VVE28594.1 hypothetical protein PPN31114_03532 [Pandoraea pneumonica]